MAGDSIDVKAKDGSLTIQVRNMISMGSKAKEVLEIQPLQFCLDIALKLADHKKDGAGTGSLRKEVQEAMSKLDATVTDAVAKAQVLINKEVKMLGEEVSKQAQKDQDDDKDAYQNACKLVKNAAQRLDDIVEGLPPSVREATKKVIKECASVFVKEKLTCVGTWGFRGGDRGIRVRPGVFKNVTHDGGDTELWKALAAARSSRYEFVLVEAGEGGLVLRKSITGAQTKLARDESGGGGRPMFGDIKYDKGVYHFELDQDCSQSKAEKLARKIRTIVKNRCKQTIKVKVSDDDQDVDDEPEAKAAAKI